MNIKSFYIFLFSVIFFSCGTEKVKIYEVKAEISKSEEIVKKEDEATRLEKFFKRSELDSSRAGLIIEKNKIIQHLTHLRKMDRGGKKYYLLEKDDITEMIRSVTAGIYLDYILINHNGDIIYTSRENGLFGTNVNSGYEETPLKKCFINRSGVYFEDFSFISSSSKVYSLYIATPIYVEGSFHGTLILQLEMKKLSGILEPETEIFSRDGIIRVTNSEERIFIKYSGFEKIDMNELNRDGVTYLYSATDKLKFSKFNFKGIDWILVNKEKI